ncbi:MAG: protein-export chaperone SecB, partial [Candidatus Puniceispirillaceae bacterium]
MAKNSKATKTPAAKDNGKSSSTDDTANVARQIIVHAQYVKDLSFENPNAPRVLIEGAGQPDVEITVNVGAQLIGENQYEVTLNLAAKATAKDSV